MTGEPVRLFSGEDLERFTIRMGLVVRDGGRLASATMRPSTRLSGEDMYPGIALKAAAITHSIGTRHPLVDGTTRLGWIALVVTLDPNEIRLDVPDDEAFDLTIRVADGRADLAEIEPAVHGRITRQPN